MTFSFFHQTGDIRCHCNQPTCVRTGYMCKSTGPQAACFVEHSGFVNLDRSSDISQHGCIEMLPIEQRTPCLEQALATFASQQQQQHYSHGSSEHNHNSTSLQQQRNNLRPQQNKSIMCCLDDMCNYVKSIIDENGSNNNNNADDDGAKYGRRPISSFSNNNNNNNENIDSLGRHLQESYRTNGLCSNFVHDFTYKFMF